MICVLRVPEWVFQSRMLQSRIWHFVLFCSRYAVEKVQSRIHFSFIDSSDSITVGNGSVENSFSNISVVVYRYLNSYTTKNITYQSGIYQPRILDVFYV